ncbi:hypothetical protein MTX78_23960 (plasmid) [Hymenobacter tibetensis]|uniref:DUF4902 domain-containing protein n=1 Tax=Hymenobacter tibetensis TaxID=497967 RepID=A0ABY4D5C6_9BACT|nr:hypothetical protein [Hymenobacter tibetensis]UOG77402.1 hypothetical protein MTX78_23960 [Hymenobacter tibetensis]
MNVTEGRYLRQRQGLICAARVKLLWEQSACPTQIHMQWESEYGGYDDWKNGAIAGLAYALHCLSNSQTYRIVVVDIVGTDVDTNPTIVALAALEGLWEALQYSASPAQWEELEAMARQSWQQDWFQVPVFPTTGDRGSSTLKSY